MPLVVALCLGFGLAAPGWAQDPGQPLTSFRGEFDPATALTVAYGRASWNGESLSRTSLPEGREFIELLYDAAYAEGGVDKHVVIATLTPQPRIQHDCHACTPMLGGAVFRRDGDSWRLEAKGLEIEPGHPWYDGRHGRLALVRVGPDRYGLLHEVHDMGQGHESMRASVILGVDGVLSSRLIVPPVGGPGPGACAMPGQRLEVHVVEPGTEAANVAAPPGGAGAGQARELYDVVVDAAWNDAQCLPVAGGTAARSTGQSCQRTTRYQYREGAYVQVAVEADVCRALPEVTVDFRG